VRREEVSPWDAASDSESFGLLETEPVTRVGAALGPKAHVLVCAPSNSALDEIVARLLQYGLLDWYARVSILGGACLPPYPCRLRPAGAEFDEVPEAFFACVHQQAHVLPSAAWTSLHARCHPAPQHPD
jgi:hypothetical protein